MLQNLLLEQFGQTLGLNMQICIETNTREYFHYTITFSTTNITKTTNDTKQITTYYTRHKNYIFMTKTNNLQLHTRIGTHAFKLDKDHNIIHMSTE